MKLEKIEKYRLELDKEELLFLLEVIEKMKLDPSSSPRAFEIMERFKDFRSQEVQEEPNQELKCDGCESDVDVEMREDPSTQSTIPLCFVCLAKRTGYSKLVDEKRDS